MGTTFNQLIKAIQSEDAAAVKRCLSLNPSLVHGKHPRSAHTPLHAAAAADNVGVLRELLAAGASCQACDSSNETPLHVAAKAGQPAAVKELLADAGRRSCLKLSNRDGATPLHLAVAANSLEVVQLLVMAGARVDARDRANRTPLELCHPGQQELTDILSAGRHLTPGSGGRTRSRTSRTGSPGHSTSARSSVTSPPPGSRLAGLLAAAASDRGSVGPPDDCQHLSQRLPSQAGIQRGDTGQVHDSSEQQAHDSSEQHHCQHLPEMTQQSMWHEPERRQQQHPPASPHQGRQPLGQHVSTAVYVGSPAAATGGSSILERVAMDALLQQQRQLQPQPALVGPLRRARAAGPQSAGAAAAAAASELTRACYYNAGSNLSSPGSAQQPAGLIRQHGALQGGGGSSGGGGGYGGSSAACGGAWSSTPEASTGTLQGPSSSSSVLLLHGSSHLVLPAAGGAFGGGSILDGHGSSGAWGMATGPDGLHAGSRSGHHQPPSSACGTPRHNQQQPQPQQASLNLSGLAAAVAASGRSGPLSQPLQAQLDELSAKLLEVESMCWKLKQAADSPSAGQALDITRALDRRQAEQQVLLEQQQQLCSSHQMALQELGSGVEALEDAAATATGSLAAVKEQLDRLAQVFPGEQQALKASLDSITQLVGQLQAQVTAQGDRLDDRHATSELQMSAIMNALQSATQRLAALETGLDAVKQQQREADCTAGAAAADNARVAALESGLNAMMQEQLQQQQQLEAAQAAVAAAANSSAQATVNAAATAAAQEAAEAAACAAASAAAAQVAAADAGTASAEARLAALEAEVSELRQLLGQASNQGSTTAQQPSPPQPVDGLLSVSSRVAAIESCSQSSSPRKAAAHTAPTSAEVRALQQQVEVLTAEISGIITGAPLSQGGSSALEESLLPFMETTSACLQQHEQQLDALQALLPKVEGMVAQRTQMAELMQQVASLQTAFDLLTPGASSRNKDGSSRPCPALSSGPLGQHKAAAEALVTATNMVKLQSQMSALASAVEQLSLEWQGMAAAVKAEQEEIRLSWEAERTRRAAAEAEAARRLTEQQQELRAREDKLVQLREVALAEEAARCSQISNEARVAEQLQGLSGQQQQLQGWVSGLADTTDALKEQLEAMQAELEASLQGLAPHISLMQGNAQDAQQAAARDAQAMELASTEPVQEDGSHLAPPVMAAEPADTDECPCPSESAKASVVPLPDRHAEAYWQEDEGQPPAQQDAVAAGDVVCHVETGAAAEASPALAATNAAAEAGSRGRSSSWLERALMSRKSSGGGAQDTKAAASVASVKLFGSRKEPKKPGSSVKEGVDDAASQQQQQPQHDLFGDDLLLCHSNERGLQQLLGGAQKQGSSEAATNSVSRCSSLTASEAAATAAAAGQQQSNKWMPWQKNRGSSGKQQHSSNH